MRVKKIDRTRYENCSCGGWLLHWKRFSGQNVTICKALGCSGSDISGALIQRDAPDDSNWYIVPLCSAHMKKNEAFELDAGTFLVRVYENLTYCKDELKL